MSAECPIFGSSYIRCRFVESERSIGRGQKAALYLMLLSLISIPADRVFDHPFQCLPLRNMALVYHMVKDRLREFLRRFDPVGFHVPLNSGRLKRYCRFYGGLIEPNESTHRITRGVVRHFTHLGFSEVHRDGGRAFHQLETDF